MSKRKVETFDDSDDEDAAPGRQILPVAKLPADFNEPPADGLQYLFMVRCVLCLCYLRSSKKYSLVNPRRDAKQLPFVTSVVNPYDTPVPVLPPSNVIRGSTSSLPSPAWRSACETRFRNFRIVGQFNSANYFILN